MNIKSLEFKNIGPYGNLVQHIDFSNKNELINISARNGSGKSTIFNTINFALYGKVKDLTLKDIVNRINKKNAWAKIVLENGSDIYEIERGVAPSKFKVTKNTQEIDVAGKKNVQQFLEEEVYKMNFNVFTNTISLSVNDFKSFLTMSPGDKRTIIDRLFGYYIINEIAEKIKKKKSSIDEDTRRLNNIISEKENTIDNVRNKIEAIENNEEVDYTKENEEIAKKLIQIKERHATLKTELETKKEDKEKKVTVKDKLSEAISTINNKLRDILKKLKLYDDNKCPTCGGDLTVGDHVAYKAELISQKESLETKLQECDKRLEIANSNLSKVRNECDEVTVKLQKLVNAGGQYKTKLESNKTNAEKNKDNLVNQFQELIKQTKESLDELQVDLDGYKKKTEYYKLLLEEILSEKGIRGVLTNRIIGPLNILVNKYTNLLDFDKPIKYDGSFDVEVKHLGQVINVKTLSIGERKKADLIMIFSFIELIILQNPNNNVLFLDEIFSSLDPENIDAVITSLKMISKKFNMNIFIVSHNNIERTHFDKYINVVKENGFSSFEIESIR